MHLENNYKLQQACLACLELVVLALFVIGSFVDLSFLDVWQYWIALIFFWLVVLLFAASLRMLLKHRLLAMTGLGLVTVIVVTAFLFCTFMRAR